MKKNLPAFLSLLVYLLIIITVERIDLIEFRPFQSSLSFERYSLFLLSYWPIFSILTLIYQWILFEKFPASKGFHIFQIILGVIWFLSICLFWIGFALWGIGRIIFELSMIGSGIVNAGFAFIAGCGVVGLLRERGVKREEV